MKYLLKTDDINALKIGGGADYERIALDSSDNKIYVLEKPIEYETVDLGLPSGTLWMKKWMVNSNGEDLYYQWGDTQGWTTAEVEAGKKIFNGEHYKYLDYDSLTLTKYSTYGVIEPLDDAILVATQGKFRMPTFTEVMELCDNTTFTYSGYTITLKSKLNNEQISICNTVYKDSGLAPDAANILSNGYETQQVLALFYRSNQINASKDFYSLYEAWGATLKGVVNK